MARYIDADKLIALMRKQRCALCMLTDEAIDELIILLTSTKRYVGARTANTTLNLKAYAQTPIANG